MAEIDTGIYKVAPPPNPLDTAAKFYDINNAALNSKLLGQQVQGNAGFANALTGGVDPVTGQFDPAKAIGAAGGAGVRAGDVVNDALTLQDKQQALAVKQATDLANGFGSLLQSNPNLTHDDVVKLANQYLMQPGRLSKQLYDQIIHEIPTDPAAVRAYVQNRFIATLPQGGAAEAKQGVDQNLAPVTGTQGQAVVKATGGAPAATGAAPPAKGGPPVASAAPPLSAGFVSGAAPGQEDSMRALAATATQQAGALSTAAEQYPQQAAVLKSMEEHLGEFSSGPLADATKTIKAAINQMGGNFDPTGVSAQELFEKNAYQIALGQLGALGAPSDARLAATTGASPNVDYSTMGNQRIIHMLRGNADAINAKNVAWQAALKSGVKPSDYSGWSSNFNQTFDPRIFQFAYMTKSERQTMYDNMSPADRADFEQRGQEAIANGWYKPSGGAGGK